MSRLPSGRYGYSCPGTSHYMEPENYLPEYSDSEVLMSNAEQHMMEPHQNDGDFTEIYARKHPIPAEPHYEYYYEPSAGQIADGHPPLQQSQQNLVYRPRVAQYYASPVEYQDNNYDSVAFHHSASQINSMNQHVLLVEKPRSSKRYPITVPTPRYYHPKSATSIPYKKPTALCLPLTSQPDPAIYARNRRIQAGNTPQYRQQESEYYHNVRKKRSRHNVPTHKTNSQGDANIPNHLDSKLAEYEEDAELREVDQATRTNIAEIAQYFKPREPPSLKQKREKLTFKQEFGELTETEEHIQKLIPQQYHPPSLEKLLNQLKKCETSYSSESLQGGDVVPDEVSQEPVEATQGFTQTDEVKEEESQEAEIPAEEPPSFNYKDISQHFLDKTDSNSKIQTEVVKKPSGVSTISSGRPRSKLSRQNLKPLDDNGALELHRSKSYIVNLIDRALSKELGTIPSGKSIRKEFDNLSPKKAIDLMNRHIAPKATDDKHFCLELTSALTDSIISSATVPEEKPAHFSPSKICCCRTDEPVYIKQLKQLRWGHLKHIQQEVKRLEELERFLDSCSNNSSEE